MCVRLKQSRVLLQMRMHVGKGERNIIQSAYTLREKQNQQHHMTFIATGADPDLIKLSDLPGIIS